MKGKYPNIPKALLLSVVFLLSAGQMSFGAAGITVSSGGIGIYSLRGSDMDGVASMNIVLKYDTKKLSKPRVVPGSLIKGAMVAANPDTPGIIKIALIRTTPFKGSGEILSITFDSRNSTGGAHIDLSVKAADINGKPMPVMVHIGNK